MPRRLQSILALAAGFVLIVILVFEADAAYLLPTPHDPASFALMLWSMLVCVASGGYVTARLAPRRPLRHALELGLLVMFVTAVMYWLDVTPGNHAATQISVLIVILPAAWLGGTLARVLTSLSA